MKIENKVAIVTGGASGLGEATVRKLIDQKAKVVIADMNEENGQQLQKELGENAFFVQTDVTNEESIKNLVKMSIQKFQKIHILVNSAGILHARTLINKGGIISSEEYQRVFQVNVFGTFTVSKYVAECMSKQEAENGERGVIIHVASIAGIEGQKGQILYGGSKGAILGMTLPMARDLARFGIRVVSLAPGPIATPMGKNIPPKALQELERSIPTGRIGYPSEFSHAVQSLIENSFINGTYIRLDGGLRMGFL